MCYCLTGWLGRTTCGTGRWHPHLSWCCVIRHWLWLKIFSWSLFKSVVICRLDQHSPKITAWCVLYQCVCLFVCRLILWSQTQYSRHLSYRNVAVFSNQRLCRGLEWPVVPFLIDFFKWYSFVLKIKNSILIALFFFLILIPVCPLFCLRKKL